MEKQMGQGLQGPTHTTFVHADINTFRELVHHFTSASDGDRHTPTASLTDANEEAPPAHKIAGAQRSTLKLHERRQCMRPKLPIVKPGFHLRPGQPVHSPSSPGFQATEPPLPPPVTAVRMNPLALSPPAPDFTTGPLSTPSESFSNLSIFYRDKTYADLNQEEEEKAIKERRFYLHPSTRSGPGNAEPVLLTLFPLTSPKTHRSLE